MQQTPFGRLLALLLALSLAAIACTSSDTGDAASTTSDNESSIAGDDNGEPDDPSEADDVEAPVFDGPVDPESARELVQRLTGLEVEGDPLTCLVSNADDDVALSSVLNGWQEETFQFTPEAYTVLTVNVHDCVDPVTLSGTLIGLAGGSGDAADFATCLTTEFGDEQNGDLAYVGLSALQVNFPVPEGAQDATVAAAANCVTNDILAGQLGASREQAAGFTVEVDRDCVANGLDESFRTTFWEGIVTNDPATNPELEPLLEECSSTFDSGLPKEIPADFVEFAGEGVLAGVDPLTRNGAYSEAPSMRLEDGVDYQAVITTDDGEIVIDLYEDTAPITVNSFVALAQDGYYDQTIFHRVLDGFMAQAGDPTGTGSGGPGYSFEDEESGLTAIDRRGLLAMANSGPDTNGSQFFITLDAADWLDGLHTVFGEVIEGDDVLAAIQLRDPQAPTSRGESLLSIEIRTV